MALAPGSALADGLSGFVDYALSTSDSKSTSGGVPTSKGTSTSLTQRYGLSLDKSLFPLVRLSAGSIFEKNLSESIVDRISTSSESHRLSPVLSLTTSNPFMPSSLGYSRTEQTSSGSGSPAATNVTENYNMRLGLRPEGLPGVDLGFSRANSFDPARSRQDVTSDSYILSSRYQPMANMDLGYQGSLTEGQNRLSGQKNSSISNTVIGSYTRQLFANRLNLFTNAALARNESTSSSGKKEGIIFTAPFPGPRVGLSAVTSSVSFPPVSLLSGQLADNASLANGGALISIVAPSVTTGLPESVMMGLAFDDTTAFNTLFLTVTSDSSTPLTSQIVSRYNFVWDIYSSSDGVNWEKKQTIANAPFDFNPSTSAAGKVGFILNLSQAISTKFVKVAVTPPQLINVLLDGGVKAGNIQATKLEVLLAKPAAEVGDQKSSSTSGLWNFGVKAKLLEGNRLPTVYYDGSYNTNFSQQGAGASTANFISNGLSAFYKMNRYLQGSARFSRSDAKSTSGERSTDYSYSASVNSQFLSTLQQAVTYSGRRGTTGDKTSSSNSLFINNSAVLYKGISANLSGGLSLTSNSSGMSGQNTVATFGATISPHPTLSVTGNLSGSSSKQSGGGTPATASQSGSGTMTASYSPLSSLSISGAFAFTALEGKKPVITRNFGGNWSPFREGELQFNFGYFESLNSAGDQVTRSISPALRWSFRSGCWLDLSYSWASTEQTAVTTETTESSSISSTLRMSF
jgi:hypothetical protein